MRVAQLVHNRVDDGVNAPAVSMDYAQQFGQKFRERCAVPALVQVEIRANGRVCNYPKPREFIAMSPAVFAYGRDI